MVLEIQLGGHCHLVLNSAFRRQINAFAYIALLVTQTFASPVWMPQFLSGGTGRNIRHLPCISRRSGEKGTCMFAYTCMKANGTHLGTCIDRFYFGSCCKLPGDGDPLLENDLAYPQVTNNKVTNNVIDIDLSKFETTLGVLKTTTEKVYVPILASSPKPNKTDEIFGEIMKKPVTVSTTTPPTTTQQYFLSTFQVVHDNSPFTTTTPTPITKPSSTIHWTAINHTSTSTKSTTVPPVRETTTAKPATTTKLTTTSVTNTTTKRPTKPPKTTTKKPPTKKPTNKPTTKPTTIPTKPTTVPTKPSAIPTKTTTPKPVRVTQTPKPTTIKKPATTTTVATVATTTKRPVPPTTIYQPISTVTNKPTGTKKPSTTTKPTVVTTQRTPTVAPISTTSEVVFTKPGSFPPNLTYTQFSTFRPDLSHPTTKPDIITGPGLTTFSYVSDKVTATTSQPISNEISTPRPSTARPDIEVTEEQTNVIFQQSGTPTQTTQVTQETTVPFFPETTKPDGTKVPWIEIVQGLTSTPSPTSLPTTMETETTTGFSPSFGSVNVSDYTDVCGRRLYPEARIVGGEKASFGKWPWQISLRQWRTSTYLHKCGAALLNENWAITAAHCVENVPPSDLLLRLGEHDLSTEEEPYGYQERRVQIVASHPQFDPRTFEYDLALLRFYEPVKFQPNIIPVCVPQDSTNFVGQTAHVTGWGRLYEDGPLPSVLQEVSVPVINNTLCENMYRSAGYIEHIPDIFICAGWKKGGFDSCEGDSGGPMVIQRPDKRWLLAGVISWGIGCAEPNQPGVYTRISEFREWINQILQF